MSRAKAVQLLLAKNYNVYIPISIAMTLAIEKDNELKKCYIRTVAIPKLGAPIVSVVQRTGKDRRFLNEQSADYILCVSASKLWLIPVTDVASFISIRLGKKWEHCVLGMADEVGKMGTVKDRDGELRHETKRAVESALNILVPGE